MYINSKIIIYNDILSLYISRYQRFKHDRKRLAELGFYKNYFIRIQKIVNSVVKSLIFKCRKETRSKQYFTEKEFWFFANTYNNVTALKPLSEKFHNNYAYLTIRANSRDYVFSISGQDVINYSCYKFYHNFAWLLSYFKALLKNEPKVRSFYIKYPHVFFRAYVDLEIGKSLLKNDKPKVIVFANDINIQNRALIYAAQKVNVPTVYVQHAAVNSNFPELIVDLALLEGQYSADVYKFSNRTTVKLIGQPKFEKLKPHRKVVKNIKNIGLAFNTLDDLEKLYELSAFLVDRGYLVYLRPHPREKRIAHHSWRHIYYHSSQEDTSYDFLQKIDLLVASDSSIHLESILINIPSVYFNMNQGKAYDHYNFIKNGLITEVNNLDELEKAIKNYKLNDNSFIFKRAKYYCYSAANNVNSIDEAVKHIKSLIY